MTHALTYFLNPQSVAIIGVSPNPSFINAILNNLLRWQYDKPIYLVNPNYRDIAGLQTYPRISDVPEAVDLAVVSVPSRMMPDIRMPYPPAGSWAARPLRAHPHSCFLKRLASCSAGHASRIGRIHPATSEPSVAPI